MIKRIQEAIKRRKLKMRGCDVWGDINKVKISDSCNFGGNVRLSGNDIIIGNDCMIAYGAQILSITHDYNSQNPKTGIHKRVKICDRVWIGCNAIILPGVTIGSDSVVGAGSVVTHDVPDMTVVAGNPAKEINKVNKLKLE